jgi:hypothetical protein
MKLNFCTSLKRLQKGKGILIQNFNCANIVEKKEQNKLVTNLFRRFPISKNLIALQVVVWLKT